MLSPDSLLATVRAIYHAFDTGIDSYARNTQPHQPNYVVVYAEPSTNRRLDTKSLQAGWFCIAGYEL